MPKITKPDKWETRFKSWKVQREKEKNNKPLTEKNVVMLRSFNESEEIEKDEAKAKTFFDIKGIVDNRKTITLTALIIIVLIFIFIVVLLN